MKLRQHIAGALTVVLLALAAALPAQGRERADAGSRETPDTLGHDLQEVEVRAASRQVPRIAPGGAVSFDNSILATVPRTLGEADMLRAITLLPGVTSASDYAAGASINGSDYSENATRINGMPIIFPYHFGGIFSTFHPDVYTRGSLEYDSFGSDAAAVAGGTLDLSAPRRPSSKNSFALNVGLTASSLYADVAAIPDRLSFTGSVRGSYITAVYGPILGGRDGDVAYDFIDVEFMPKWKPAPDHFIVGTFHYNNDRLRFADANYALDSGIRWSNLDGSLSWQFTSPRSGLKSELQAYWAQYNNWMELEASAAVVKIRSKSSQGAIKYLASLHPSDRLTVHAGATAELYRSQPQHAKLSGYAGLTGNVPPIDTSCLARISADAEWRAAEPLLAEFSLKADQYFATEYHPFAVLPQVRLTFLPDMPCSFSLTGGLNRQYYHYVGLTEIGMPSNFRMTASSAMPVENAWHSSVDMKWRLPASFQFTASVYYKWLTHSAEYEGNVVEMLSDDYLASDHVMMTRGYNTGFNVMALREAGAVTGWLGYSFCVAKRQNPATGEWFTSTTQIRNAVKAALNWNINSHWTLFANFNYNTGRPFTPITLVYLIGNRLIMEYGKRNSSNYPAYHRLDIGATYKFSTPVKRFRLDHEVNFSFFNVYGHRNVEMQTYSVDPVAGTYYLRRQGSLYRFLPSLSYTLRL